jgi:hypothetical protein
VRLGLFVKELHRECLQRRAIPGLSRANYVRGLSSNVQKVDFLIVNVREHATKDPGQGPRGFRGDTRVIAGCLGLLTLTQFSVRSARCGKLLLGPGGCQAQQSARGDRR